MSEHPEETFRAYVKAFESLDQDAIVSFYHTPCMFIGPPGVTLATDRQTALGIVSHLIEHARSQDYRRTNIEVAEVRVLAVNLASISGVFVRVNSKEEEISRFGFAYTLLKNAGGWKIVVATAHDLPHQRG